MAQGFAKKLYSSKAWQELRFNLILERGPKCQACGALVLDTSRLIGHHKVLVTEHNVNNPEIVLNPNNIELICFACHNKEHKRFGAKNERCVYVVYGAPLSGKTTLVHQLAQYGDLVLDIDSIYAAISMQELKGKPNNLRFNVFAIRDKILDMVRTRYGDWYNAYIIGGYPNKFERERLANDLGAELVYCESTKEECYERARALQNKFYLEKFIEKWWKEYMP